MDQTKIDMFLASNGRKFFPHQLSQIEDALKNASDSKFQIALSMDYKDPNTMLLVSIFAGGFGVDRFMLEQTGLGVLKLLTGGACGVWYIFDLFLIQDRTKAYNYDLFMRVIS